MQRPSDINVKRGLKRFTVGALPLIHGIAERMRLREILTRHLKRHGNESIHAADTLLLLIYNLAIGKSPLYELEHWCASIDLSRIGMNAYAPERFNDDRFGKALDKLYAADRSSLMTDLVVQYVKTFGIAMDELHNDSTSVKAFGRIPGKTTSGMELVWGNSKDHRPDLRQLIYTLSISADGGIPIHHRCYSGNKTDDTTHIETWNILRRIADRNDFLYVADSKVCTDEQLTHISMNGGRVVTIIPDTWREVGRFKDDLRRAPKSKRIIWRRSKPNSDFETEYFSEYAGTHLTEKRGYRIHWIYSSEKRKRDRGFRESLLQKAETELMQLNSRINTRKYKNHEEINTAAQTILKSYQVQDLIRWKIAHQDKEILRQKGRGRPTISTKYERVTQRTFTLSWARDRTALVRESRLDGIFPLLTTDHSLGAKQALQAYKYQPRLEKRFSQFKSVHNAAPLLFKKIERVEANMFAFFIALALQALLEREMRKKMQQEKIDKLYIYPEDRECRRPTTSIVFDRFESVSRYEISDSKGNMVEEHRDSFSKAQLEILDSLGIAQEDYWGDGVS
jgi:transposase